MFLTAAIGAIEGIQQVGDALGIGGSSGPETCPNQPSDADVQAALATADPADVRALRDAFSRAGLSSKYTTPYSIAYESYGGNHCNWDASVQSRAMKAAFDTIMAKYYTSTGRQGVVTDNAGQSLAPTANDKSILDRAKEIGKDAVNAALDKATTETAMEVNKRTDATILKDWMFWGLVGVGVVGVILIVKRSR